MHAILLNHSSQLLNSAPGRKFTLRRIGIATQAASLLEMLREGLGSPSREGGACLGFPAPPAALIASARGREPSPVVTDTIASAPARLCVAIDGIARGALYQGLSASVLAARASSMRVPPPHRAT